MSLEIEYERSYQVNELEKFQNLFIKYVRYNIKSMCPCKIILSIIDEHVKESVPYSVECEYKLDHRSKDKGNSLGVATIYHPPLIKNLKRSKI